ncbi:TonB-dependent receptor [Aquincola sp. S2]|uniref:TonB-dependent receptor n=1 Tax=Pseudaquabacterium terrae TaxID=2732868 RepID=A0ABX2EHM5_9BURK|nr:TonB-dependent receptor [Aquabacterium terrae]NRF68133.1 TonB-dependent receptor [Aquabacterium terrae]
MLRVRNLVAAPVAIAVLVCAAPVQARTYSGNTLAELSLEQLGNIEITSVSRRAQRLSDAPTSVFVITADDIRRAGPASLPEVLRLAPNLQVARSANRSYSISARGFDSALSNKLLVLIDGRSIYTPLYSGVFWDAQEVMLEDIERIEVISGSGATLWGVNAVNGVINIITRSAAQRAGTLATAVVGERQRRLAGRSGGSFGGSGHYTVYGLHIEQDGNATAAGAPARDAARHAQLGLRIDTALADGDFTLIGDVSRGRIDQPPGSVGAQGTEKSGANLLARWQRPLAGGSLMLQAYAEHTRRTSVPTLDDTQDIIDLQLQHAAMPIGDHLLSWGLELRRGRNHSGNSRSVAFLPPLANQTWNSVYLQDEFQLGAELQVTLGLRADRNDYTGTEALPTVRLAWRPDANQLWWAAASRAVRAPARLDRDLFLPGVPPFALRGGPGFQSEVANDLELGWRGQFGVDATLSVTAFRTEYSRLRGVLLDASRTAGIIGNAIDGRSHGIEAWGSWQPLPSWRLHAGGALLRQRAELRPGFNDSRSVATLEGGNPRHWWLLRSSHDLGERLELDLTWRGVAERPASGVPSYHALALRLGWQVTPAVELSVGLRQLSSGGHAEFGALATRAEFERDAYLKAEWRF